MNESILETVKKFLGLDESYDVFDPDLVVLINSAFMTLYQLGLPLVRISDSSDTWEAVIEDNEDLEAVKEYVCLKTRVGFDPPSSSFVLDSFKDAIRECEWRLMVQKTEFTNEEVSA